MASEESRSTARDKDVVNSTDTERSGAARGQKIVKAFGRDDSSYDLPNTHGGKMGGSATNLAHSLSGASAVQDNK